MRIIDLALKDLLQIVRDKKSALFLLLMPIAFTIFFGVIFSGSGAAGDARLPVGVVDLDDGSAASRRLVALLNASDAVRVVALDSAEADSAGAQVRDGKLAGALIVPAGYGAGLLAGEEAQPILIVDEKSSAGQTARNAVASTVLRLRGSAEAARISADAYAGQRPFQDEAARQAYMNEAFDLASKAWETPRLTVAVQQAQPPATKGLAQSSNPYVQSSPGMLVQFAIYGLVSSSMVLVLERKNRAMGRLLTTPMSRAGIIAGHVLAMFLIGFIQEIVLVALGQLAFGVNYMAHPLATLLVMVALALWVACLGLFIGAISKKEDGVIMWSLIAMFVFSALGGAWFSLEFTGKAFSTIGHLTPGAWAMDGFQNIVMRGLGFDSALLPAGILLLYAGAFFALALWRFRFE